MRHLSAILATFLALTACSRDLTLKITDMGAKTDSGFDNALIINAAIDSCNRAGGGTVIVPAGGFMSGTIYLKAGVELKLEAGAEIASMPFDQWPYFPSYGAYFRNVGEVVLDNVTFSTIGPDDRDDVFTDNVGSLTR